MFRCSWHKLDFTFLESLMTVYTIFENRIAISFLVPKLFLSKHSFLQSKQNKNREKSDWHQIDVLTSQ